MLLHTHGLQWDRSNGCKTGFWFLPQPCLLPPLPCPACLGQALGGWWRCCVLFLSINLPSVWGIRISLFRAWHAQVTEWWACVGIDVSWVVLEFLIGCSWDAGKPSKGMTCGIDANCTFRSDPRHLEPFPVFRIILKYQHDEKTNVELLNACCPKIVSAVVTAPKKTPTKNPSGLLVIYFSWASGHDESDLSLYMSCASV